MSQDERKSVHYEIEDGMVCGVSVEILQFFDKLDWSSKDNEPNPNNEFIPNLDNINSRPEEAGELKLKAYKLINDELSLFNANKDLYASVKLPKKKNDFRCLRHYYVPGVEDKNPPYPPLNNISSELTMYQQRELFSLMQRNNLGLKIDGKDRQSFQTLLHKVSYEESKYQHFVKTQWTNCHAERCLKILPSVQKFMVDLWAAKRIKCMGIYPLNYNPIIQGVRLAGQDAYQNHAVLEFQKEICRRGFRPRMILLSQKYRADLLTDYNDLLRLKPIIKLDRDSSSSSRPMCSETPVVSEDRNVQNILDSENVDVVLSSGTLKTLVVDTDKEPWYLPVSVRTFQTADGKTKKVVFIDKKLPKNYMSTHDMNLAHAKITIKWPYILHSLPELYESSNPIRDSGKRSMISYDDLITSELDRIQLKSEDFNDSKRLFQGPQALKHEHTPKVSNIGGSIGVKEGNKENGTAELSIGQRSEASLPCTAEVKSESLSTRSPYRPKLKPISKLRKDVLNQCLVYNLFNLHKSNEDPMLKIDEKRRLNILVRSKCDGSLAYFKFGNRYTHDVHISSKVEFQPEYGASKLTRSELMKEYIDLRLRPDNILLRVRSVGHTKELMMQEVKSLGELSRIPGLVTDDLFDPLYSVLTKVIDLSEGQYLVCHGPTAGFFADIMAPSDRMTNGFSMERYFHTLAEVQPQLPPPDLDPGVITPIHLRHRIPPAVLRPKLIKREPMRMVPEIFRKQVLTVREKKGMKKKAAKLKKRKQKQNKKERLNEEQAKTETE